MSDNNINNNFNNLIFLKRENFLNFLNLHFLKSDLHFSVHPLFHDKRIKVKYVFICTYEDFLFSERYNIFRMYSTFYHFTALLLASSVLIHLIVTLLLILETVVQKIRKPTFSSSHFNNHAFDKMTGRLGSTFSTFFSHR